MRTGSNVRALTARMSGFRYTKRTLMYQSPSRVDEVGASSAGVLRKRRSNFRVHLRTTIVLRKYQGPVSKSLLSHHS
jgi:hypothetical protein